MRDTLDNKKWPHGYEGCHNGHIAYPYCTCFIDLEYELSHSAGNVELQVTPNGNRGCDDESFGLSQVEVYYRASLARCASPDAAHGEERV